MGKDITRRDFIKAGAIGVAATTICPALISPGEVFGQASGTGSRMFCYQCEQTSKGTGCNVMGVCGKSPQVAALHDLLVYSLKGLSVYAVTARGKGIEDPETNRFIPAALFSTLTNVNFDPERFSALIHKSIVLRDGLKQKVASAGGSPQFIDGPVSFQPASTIDGLVQQGKKAGLKADAAVDPDLQSLHHTLLFGLKGLSAYVDHARELGHEDDKVYHYIQEALLADMNKKLGVNEVLGVVLKCGEINLRALELLDAANTSQYGHPVATKVPLGAKRGKAILVSGHDLIDLEQILMQKRSMWDLQEIRS